MNSSGPCDRPDHVDLPASSLPRLLADRTAVLVVGIVAGFATGMAFAPANDVPVPLSPTGGSVRPTIAAPAAIDPRVVQRVRASGKVRIGVFGDSFGLGVWDALYRMLPAADGFEVLRFAKEATGLTRYRVLDMRRAAQDDLARYPIDIAVISLGVNDAQPMYEGRLYPFMGDGWKTIVGGRVDALVNTARSTGAAVYWLGLPAMRDAPLDGKVRMLNAFYADRMARLGVPFLDARALSVDDRGRYASHLPDATGAPRLMRTGDGIHMIGIGYQRVSARLVARIRAQALRIRAAAGRPAPSPSPSRR